MELIPSLDLISGRVVRLRHGDFETAREYGAPEAVLDQLGVPDGSRLHLVDLEASRRGVPMETEVVRRLASRNLLVQVGGGIRSLDDARRWLDCGAARIVVGTVAANSPRLLEALVATFGSARIVPAVDIRDGVVRTDGWERAAQDAPAAVFTRIESLGFDEVLVTDIAHDGVLRGPSFALYRALRATTRLRIIASGGVSTSSDIMSLARLPNVGGCVIGRALLERHIDLRDALARISIPDTIPERVIPCLDIRDGRVVKGVSFDGIRDAGDPVECAMRYESEGADELVLLDIAATDRREQALATIRSVADSIFIPLTVGGGVTSREDFRALLRAGADRVAINTAALRRPELIEECAAEFGVQAVVLSCDAKRDGDRWLATIRGGKETTTTDAVGWCVEAERRGAGEILLTSVDRDGTQAGFDLDLLRAVSSRVHIGVIASGGAGNASHFASAIETGGARAVLAASLFHDGVLSVGDVKRHLAAEGIPVR
jgi:imidazole glycerol-phosphate synthase subunit HisF